MKTILIIPISLLVGLTLLGCGGSDSNTKSPAVDSSQETADTDGGGSFFEGILAPVSDGKTVAQPPPVQGTQVVKADNPQVQSVPQQAPAPVEQNTTKPPQTPAKKMPAREYPQFELSELEVNAADAFTLRWKLLSGRGFGAWDLIVEEPGEPFWTMTLRPFPDEQSGYINRASGENAFTLHPLKLKIGSQIYVATHVGITEGYQKLSNTLKVTGSPIAKLETVISVEPLTTPDGSAQPLTNDTPIQKGHKLERKRGSRHWVPVMVTNVLEDGQVETLELGRDAVFKKINNRADLRIPAQTP